MCCRVLLIDASHLLILDVGAADAGVYECRAENSARARTSSVEVAVVAAEGESHCVDEL